MRWEKHGLVFEPNPKVSWYAMSAMLPFADPESEDTAVRVYFSGRDAEGRARIGYFVVDLPTRRMLYVSPAPVLDLGPLGAFDDSGVTGGCIVTHQAKKYLYFSGWTRGVSVPFYDYVGLAVSSDGGQTFERVSPAPILERNRIDPYLTGPPCVLIENGRRWRMWYSSGVRWDVVDGQPKHFYHIRYAESSNGIEWDRSGHVCIDFASPDEYAIARPVVVRDVDCYRMWYAYRGGRYRIGYAESDDGLAWKRKDHEVGIDVSEAGWDSEMIEYAYVMTSAGSRHMFYNGNGYGRSGIGYARCS
jgi:hypothetical protein